MPDGAMRLAEPASADPEATRRIPAREAEIQIDRGQRERPSSVNFLDERYSHESPRLLVRAESGPVTAIVRENARFRWLEFGNGIVQSAMELAQPHRLALPYTQSMMSPLLFGAPPGKVLLLGMGGGALVRYLRHHLGHAGVTAVERSPEIIDFARAHFGVAQEPARVEIVAADARTYMASRPAAVDLILVDLFDEAGPPGWLADADFYADCHASLAPGGALSLNLLGPRQEEFVAILTAVRRGFSGHTLRTTLVDYENVIVLAFAREPDDLRLSSLRRRARCLEAHYAAPFARILRNIAATNPVRDGRIVTLGNGEPGRSWPGRRC